MRRTRSTRRPASGDLPILGNLFKSTEFRKGQTELVIVVTPYLVNPVDANDIKLPTDGFRAPDRVRAVARQQGERRRDRRRPAQANRHRRRRPTHPRSASRITTLDDKDRPRSAKADDRRAEADPAPGFSLK